MKKVIHLTNLPNLKEDTEIKFVIPANAGSSLNVEFVFPQELVFEPIMVQTRPIMGSPSPTLVYNSPPIQRPSMPTRMDNPLSPANARTQSPVTIPPNQRLTMNSPQENLQQLSGEELSNVYLESQSINMPVYMTPYRCTPAVDLNGNATCELQGRSTMK